MQKLLAKCRKANAGPTDQQTDRPTDRQTDIVPYRVALQATKNYALSNCNFIDLPSTCTQYSKILRRIFKRSQMVAWLHEIQ